MVLELRTKLDGISRGMGRRLKKKQQLVSAKWWRKRDGTAQRDSSTAPGRDGFSAARKQAISSPGDEPHCPLSGKSFVRNGA